MNKTFDGEVTKCTDKRCGCCPYLLTGKNFNFHKAGFEFRIKAKMTCATQNLLYVLVCMGCNEYYIGQTMNALRKRNRIHKQQTNNPAIANCTASKHVHVCARDKPIQYKIMPFFKINSPNSALRYAKEIYFIEKTKAALNHIH